MSSEIVERADCAASSAEVWATFLRSARLEGAARTCLLERTTLRVRACLPRTSLRGTAQWEGVTYRVAAFFVPFEGGTRLLVTARVHRTDPEVGVLQRRRSRRAATHDLRELVRATCAETARHPGTRRARPDELGGPSERLA